MAKEIYKPSEDELDELMSDFQTLMEEIGPTHADYKGLDSMYNDLTYLDMDFTTNEKGQTIDFNQIKAEFEKIRAVPPPVDPEDLEDLETQVESISTFPEADVPIATNKLATAKAEKPLMKKDSVSASQESDSPMPTGKFASAKTETKATPKDETTKTLNSIKAANKNWRRRIPFTKTRKRYKKAKKLIKALNKENIEVKEIKEIKAKAENLSQQTFGSADVAPLKGGTQQNLENFAERTKALQKNVETARKTLPGKPNTMQESTTSTARQIHMDRKTKEYVEATNLRKDGRLKDGPPLSPRGGGKRLGG